MIINGVDKARDSSRRFKNSIAEDTNTLRIPTTRGSKLPYKRQRMTMQYNKYTNICARFKN